MIEQPSLKQKQKELFARAAKIRPVFGDQNFIEIAHAIVRLRKNMANKDRLILINKLEYLVAQYE